jgi:hypothetical protein
VRWFSTGIIGKWFAQHRRRGATVPFEAPTLRMAKVCDDERDGMIAILHDFAQNGSTYIVPWISLPLMASMKAPDKALHKAICDSKACTPGEVRAVVSRLALSGALGPEAKAEETERSRGGQTSLSEVELVLILHLLNSCGADLAILTADPDRWRDADAKSAVAAAAATMAVQRQHIYQRVAELAKLLKPVGWVAVDGAISSGWLRVLHDEIERFGESIDVGIQPGSPDVGAYLTLIAESAAHTAQLSGRVLAMVDYAVLDISGTIRRWNTDLRPIGQTIDRLSMTLEEWPSLMKWVRDARRGPPDELIGQLQALYSVLPFLPKTDPPRTDQASSRDQPELLSASRVLGARLSTIWSLLHASHSVGRHATDAGL